MTETVKCTCPAPCPVLSHKLCPQCGRSLWRNGSAWTSFLIDEQVCSQACLHAAERQHAAATSNKQQGATNGREPEPKPRRR